MVLKSEKQKNKKQKTKQQQNKIPSTFNFYLPFFDFPSFLLHFPLFPCLSFPGRSAKISQWEMSGDTLPPAPPPPPTPRLLHHCLEYRCGAYIQALISFKSKWFIGVTSLATCHHLWLEVEAYWSTSKSTCLSKNILYKLLISDLWNVDTTPTICDVCWYNTNNLWRVHYEKSTSHDIDYMPHGS